MMLCMSGMIVATKRERWLVHLIGLGADRITIECWLEEDQVFSRRLRYWFKKEMNLDSSRMIKELELEKRGRWKSLSTSG